MKIKITNSDHTINTHDVSDAIKLMVALNYHAFTIAEYRDCFVSLDCKASFGQRERCGFKVEEAKSRFTDKMRNLFALFVFLCKLTVFAWIEHLLQDLGGCLGADKLSNLGSGGGLGIGRQNRSSRWRIVLCNDYFLRNEPTYHTV